jgi:DNA repair exonuclease SbcCD ATPase subunit
MKVSPEASTKVHKVTEDVRSAVMAVESNSTNMTKAQKHERIAGVMKELQGLAVDLFQPAADADVDVVDQKAKHLRELKEELAKKKHELEKDESMIKLYTLQKELATKKLQLEKLIEKKNNAQASKKALAEDSKAEIKLVGKLMNLTGSMPADKKAELPAPLKAALAEVKTFSQEESSKLAKVEKESKQTMATLDAEMKKSGSTNAKNDAIVKGQQMTRKLKKEEHRMFMKYQVQKKAQLAELRTVEQSIEQHDAKTLSATLVKMRHEANAAAAESGDFLH